MSRNAADKNILIRMPDCLDEKTLLDILDSGEASFSHSRPFIGKGQCFPLGRGHYARCVKSSPRYSNGLVFDYRFELMPTSESIPTFGTDDPVKTMKRLKDVSKIRSIAKNLDRYDGLRHLVPEIIGYADRLERGES